MPAIGSVNVKVSASTLGLVSGFGMASKVVRGFGGNIVSLGSGIKSGLGTALKTATSGIAGLGSSVVGLVGKFGPLGAALTGISGVGGLGLLLKNSLDTLDANKKLAGALGITQNKLTGYQHAAELSGVSSEALEGALGKLTRKGISLEVLADKMAAIKDPTERAKLAFEVLGKSGQQMIPLLTEGGDKIREMMADGVALKGSFSEADISGIEEANDAISRTQAAFVGIANTVAVFIAPALKSVADGATKMGVYIRDSFASLYPVVVAVSEAIGAAWNVVTTYVGSAFSTFAMQSGVTFTSIKDGAIAAANWLKNAFESVIPIAAKLGAFVGTTWTMIKNGAATTFNFISTIASTLYDSVGGVFSWIGEAVGLTFRNVQDAAFRGISNVIGFFYNLGTNAKSIFSWLGENWWTLTKDMGSAIVVFGGNMITNVGVAFKGLVRVATSFQGWLVGMFKRLFSFEVVDAVLTGLIAIGTKIREWASAAWESIKSIFTGSEPSDALDNFISQAKSDFKNGMEEIDLTKTVGNILSDTAKEFVNPLDGFKSSLKDLPEITLDVPGLSDAMQPLEMKPLTPPDITQMVDGKISIPSLEDGSLVVKKLDELQGPKAVQRGSTDAVSAVLKAMRGNNGDDVKKTAESTLRQMTKAANGIEKLVKEPKVELVAGVL